MDEGNETGIHQTIGLIYPYHYDYPSLRIHNIPRHRGNLCFMLGEGRRQNERTVKQRPIPSRLKTWDILKPNIMNRTFITRKQAAEILCVSEQTISNYASRGILTVDRTTENLRFLRSEVEILNRIPEQKETEQLKKGIEQMKQELLAIDAGYRERLKEHKAYMRASFTNWNRYKELIRTNINIIAKNLLNEREKDIINDILECKDPDYLQDKYQITRERIRQIIERCLRKLCKFKFDVNEIDSVKQQNAKLAEENEALRNTIKEIKGNAEKSLSSDRQSKLLERAETYPYNLHIRDLFLSVRCYNCLKSTEKIFTVNDIVNMKKTDLMKIRNFGKTSLKELERTIQKLNIEWNN